jgi:hypothetical protein
MVLNFITDTVRSTALAFFQHQSGHDCHHGGAERSEWRIPIAAVQAASISQTANLRYTQLARG